MTKQLQETQINPTRIVVSDNLIEITFFTQILREFMPQLKLVIKKDELRDEKDDK